MTARRPQAAGRLLPHDVQVLKGGIQVPGGEGLVDLVGGLGDGQDCPRRLGGHRRVWSRRGADFRFPAFSSAVSGDWGRLADVGRAVGMLA